MSDTTTTEAAAVAEDTTTTENAQVAGESTADNPEVVPGEEALGDPGKKALDSMKAERNAAKAEANRVAAELAALRAQVEGREAEFKAEQDRRAIESEALEKANDRIKKAEVRAAATGKLNDPADALRYLDLSEFEVSTDGEVDAGAIKAAIEDLVKSKPYLAAQGGATPFDTPSSHRKENAGQITRDELQRMTPEQINAARAEGRLNNLLGIKS